MPDIQKTCAISGSQFTVDERDQAFYEKIGVPAPTLCPDGGACYLKEIY